MPLGVRNKTLHDFICHLGSGHWRRHERHIKKGFSLKIPFFKPVDLWSMTRFYLFVCFLSISSKQIPCAIWRSINSKSHKCEIRDDVKCQCYKHKPFLLLLMNYYTDALLRPPTFLKKLFVQKPSPFLAPPLCLKKAYIFLSLGKISTTVYHDIVICSKTMTKKLKFSV